MSQAATEQPGNPPRHILAATDFSPGARTAVARAIQTAAEHAARVTVVHVMPPGLPPEAAHAAGQALRAHQHAAPVEVRTQVVTGSTGTEVAAAAVQIHADLIVIGAHGDQYRPHDSFIGTTAESIIDVSDKPILVVKTHDTSAYRTVLTAVDASRHTVRTAQTALALAPHARHLLAHAVTVVGEQLLRLAGTNDQDIAQLRDRQLTDARAHLADLTSPLNPAQPLLLVVEPGRPEDLIPRLAESHHVDLVVVATKKVTSIRHFLLGSVTRHTLRHAHCDVLVVHPSPGHEPDATPRSHP